MLHLQYMNALTKKILLLLIALLTTGSFIYISIAFSPKITLQLYKLHIPIVAIVLLLLFISITSFGSFLLGKRRGILLAILGDGYLLLRLFNYTHPFYLLILIMILAVIEFSFIK